MLIGALVLFGAASVACAYAQNSGQLIAARALLGLGAAVIMSLSGAVLTVLFEPSARSRAMSVWVTASALGIPLGPLLGGWLLDHFWWGAVFLINVPVVIIGVLALALWMPESRGAGGRLDPLGMVLSTAGLVAVTYGIISAGSRGWSDGRSLLTLAAGAVILAGFVGWQRRNPEPLIDLRLFRSRTFTGGGVLATLASFGMLGLLFTLPQFFAAVGGHDAFGAGLRLLPVIGGLLVGARVAGMLRSRLGAAPEPHAASEPRAASGAGAAPRVGAQLGSARVVIAAGLLLIALASFAGSRTSVDSGYGFIAVWITLAGVGLGLTLPPSLDVALGALDPARSGVGNAVLQAMRQVGGAIGVAVLGTVVSSGYRAELPATATTEVRDGVSSGAAVAQRLGDTGLLDAVRRAFTHGMDTSLLVTGVVAAAGVVLALIVLPARADQPPAEVIEPALAESGL
jgi:DHA2 family multidrug resistance protein-like MFS transporter